MERFSQPRNRLAQEPAIGHCHQPGAIQQSFHLSAYVGEVRWRAQEDGIGGDHFLHATVEEFILQISFESVVNAEPGCRHRSHFIAGAASQDKL